MSLYNYKAIVTDVYDGDSITVDIDCGFSVILKGYKLRLGGIDAAEIKGDERETGIMIRNLLRNKILNKEVYIITYKDRKEKYGRYLADVYLDNESIIDWLLSQIGVEKY